MGLETEVRFIVEDTVAARQRLQQIPSEHRGVRTIVDLWFVPREAATLEDHERWIRSTTAVPIRLRTSVQNGVATVVLQTKRVADQSCSAQETELSVGSPIRAEQFLQELGYARVAVIQRSREEFCRDDGPVYALDAYTDGTVVLEVEDETGRWDADSLRGMAREVLGSFATELKTPPALSRVRSALHPSQREV